MVKKCIKKPLFWNRFSHSSDLASFFFGALPPTRNVIFQSILDFGAITQYIR